MFGENGHRVFPRSEEIDRPVRLFSILGTINVFSEESLGFIETSFGQRQFRSKCDPQADLRARSGCTYDTTGFLKTFYEDLLTI